MRRRNALAALALLAVAALHLASVPRSIWEYDESLFAWGVERYEPLAHHPPPPGYPIYMGFAKLMPGEPFTALLATSILGLLVGLAAWFLAFREFTDRHTALLATILLYACPAVLMSGTLPQSDSGALALFGFAAWACARTIRTQNPTLAAILCAATIGWRLQFSIAIVPMFLVTLLFVKSWRARVLATGVFSAVCFAWFIPLVLQAGGPESYWKWLSGQAAYYAAHDADLSRSGQSASLIALRFAAHPWGPKWLSLPLLAFAFAGVFRARRTFAPLAAGCLVYLGFALWSMDPADAVRYAIPSLPFIALLAGIALTRFRALALVAVVYVAGAYWYASPVLRTRATTLAPPTSGANWIKANLPPNGVVLVDGHLGPHASYLLRDLKTMRIDAGMAEYGGTETPMVLYANGERGEAQGVTFRWPDTDAYRKLTRQHYGFVSVIPLPLTQRYRVVEGVQPLERRRDGAQWRWIGARGVIELPQQRGTHVRVKLRTPPEYPLDGNRVDVNGAVVELKRNESVEVLVPYAKQIVFTPSRTFIPARIPGANNRDQRTLSVMLTSVEQLDAPPAAK